MQQKKAGSQDPFAPVTAPPSTTPSIPRAETKSTSSIRRRAKQQVLPEDVAAFGEVFESTKLYVYCGLYLACQAAIYVLVKGSLTTMKTPGLMSFLHMASVCLSFWLSNSYDIFDIRPVLQNPQQSLRGCSVRAALFGVQMLTLYGALLHSSVNMVLSWAATAPLLIDTAVALAAGKRSVLLSPQIIPLVAAAAAATALEVILDHTLSWLSLLMLVLWSAAKLAETGWRLVKEDPSLGGKLPGGDFGHLAALIRRLSDAEGSLNPPSTALLINWLPALPVLMIGFLGQEGNEIIDHELSVPAVKLMLLSCVAHVGITWSQLLLHERLSGTAKAGLRWGALMGAVAFNLTEKTAGASIGTAVCAVAALGASAAASLQRHSAGSSQPGRQRQPFAGLAAVVAEGGAIDDDDDKDPES
ncbi:hypothetical protein VOLCADRAFT_117297 [Volvox carteri f. nagariensis]|uniref:Sugar phosphate transporter domain-containing protein n=1 Tax=Volvox carteri f. nagariensis TaxID=3068 RepID=D8TT95_VOLCA|nr:uncharacterized protein VOLCADRAFT_117297 [Volvox carteri f. nagariensis]EFJ49159.1 hypothetical protein VOLCADRAFT_117297 [Volvox carteri f. nagariensis]|eukprot:XP_002949607.1 hypothetical protein VOLCADRAFT_117297 [Volvox carteri f. nagariensis]